MDARKKAFFTTIVFVMMLLLAEGMSFALGRYLEQTPLFYRPVIGDFEKWQRIHHPVLGWPAPENFGSGDFDSSGSRLIPAFPDPEAQEALISLYGDSFTWSAEVGPEDSWANKLSISLRRRVNNFGVGGYGSDQALIRYLENEEDAAPIVVLSHLSENVIRNANRFRDLIGSSGQIGFKPRFVLEEDGSIRRLPIPEVSREQYVACALEPTSLLDHEEFLPGSPSGPLRLRFPFLWSILKLPGQRLVQAKLRGEPDYMDFYRDDHPSRGTALAAAIMGEFVRVALSRDQVPLLVVIPTGLDLEMHERKGIWPYAPLIAELARRGLDMLDLGPAMVRAIGDQETSDFFSNANTSKHYNAAGYELIGDIVYDRLKTEGLLPPPS